MPALDRADAAACRALQRRHGTSYFFATRLLPREHRWAVHALYAFCRVPDEIVDAAPPGTTAAVTRARLEAWTAQWRRIRAGEPTDDPVLRLAHRAFSRYAIPGAHAEAFFASMAMDTDVDRYETYEAVCRYMYGSAAVVGRMLVHLFGAPSEEAFVAADALGYAMQWTNFLRDIDEDWQERRRVYLPQDRLRAHGLSVDDIAARRWSPAFAALMQEETARADALYEKAYAGLRFLRPEARLGVLVAGRLYQAILRRLERQGGNPFAGRARTSFPEKAAIAVRCSFELRRRFQGSSSAYGSQA